MATFAREKMDVLHTTSPLYRVPASYRGKIVTTFYDFAPYRVPELFPRLSTAKLKTLYSFAAKKSDRIIAVSESTKKDAREFLGYPEEKITTIYNGIDNRFFSPDGGFNRRRLEKRHTAFWTNIFLFLGTLEPRKNLSRVLEAFAQVQK